MGRYDLYGPYLAGIYEERARRVKAYGLRPGDFVYLMEDGLFEVECVFDDAVFVYRDATSQCHQEIGEYVFMHDIYGYTRNPYSMGLDHQEYTLHTRTGIKHMKGLKLVAHKKLKEWYWMDRTAGVLRRTHGRF
jgi:hypothetical protein